MILGKILRHPSCPKSHVLAHESQKCHKVLLCYSRGNWLAHKTVLGLCMGGWGVENGAEPYAGFKPCSWARVAICP